MVVLILHTFGILKQCHSLSMFVITEIKSMTRLHILFFRFDTGWVVKIGRGLDIYKAAESKFSIGFCDFDLRPCHQTTVDIFNRKYMKDSVDTAEDTV